MKMVLFFSSFVLLVLNSVITAEETKLQQITVNVGDSITIPCNIIEYGDIPTWYINDTVYEIDDLPKEVTTHLTETTASLTIKKVQTWMNNTLFQCCFYDNKFCEAAVSIVTVDNSKMKNENAEKFEFNLKDFYFSNEMFTIAWSRAVRCLEDYEYVLIKKLRGEKQPIFLHQNNTVTIPKAEFQDGDENYLVYVEARQFDGTVCDTTDYEIQLPPYLVTVINPTEPGGEACFNYPADGSHISWPIHPDSSSFCDCHVPPKNFSECMCTINSTYEVYVKENKFVCWRNMASNNTKIFYFLELVNIDDNVIREFRFSSNIIIQSVPDPPDIYQFGRNSSNGNIYFCLNDNYNGHSDIILYEVIISTCTSYSYKTNISKEEKTCYFIQHTEKLMRDYCIPQTISIRSLNGIGYSSSQSVSIIYESYSDPCECFTSNAEINIEVLNTTSSTAYVNIQCTDISFTEYDIHLEVQVIPSVWSHLQAKCSEMLEIKDLTPNTNYMLQTIWKPEHKMWFCIIGNTKDFHTKQNNDELYNWLIKAGFAVGGFIIAIILSVALIGIINCGRRRGSRNISQETHEAGTHNT